MVHKRALGFEEGYENPDSQQTNQRFKFTLSSCLSTRRLFKDRLAQKYTVHVEKRLRKMVREVVEPIVLLHHYQSVPRSLPNEAEAAEPSNFRKFRLQFEGQLPHKLFTGNSIEAEGSVPLKIVLLDAISGEVVTYGPLSSAKFKIVVLCGSFKVEELEDWTQKDFNEQIVLARTGKSPLLVGNCVITLHKGIGFVKNISFTDNSSWVWSKTFRLGAKIEPKMSEEKQVREAVSCPFKVKHRRAYQKDSSPTLEHEVWHLEGISKDGKTHKKLKDKRIFKVKDLVQNYHTDQSSLRNALGSPRTFKAITQQIRKFIPSDGCTFQSNCTPSFIPTDAILTSKVPFSAASQDQHEVQMPCTHPMVTSHWADDSMELNLGTPMDSSLMIEELLGKSSHEGHIRSLGSNLPPSFPIDPLHGQATFNFPTSDWLSVPQSTVEVGNGSFLGTSTSPMGILPSMLNLDASTSQKAKRKRYFWSKIRAVSRMLLIKCGVAALKKGKFPLTS